MTFAADTFAVIGGAMALVLAAIKFHASWRVSKGLDPSVPKSPYSPRGMHLMSHGINFVPLLFGLVAILYSNDLASTPLGTTLSAGICIYFLVTGWGYYNAPELRDGSFRIGTFLAFAAGVCFAVVAIYRNVI
jgi:CRISPR-associated DxTHG motif protein